jgi:hypothetical protein
MGAIAWSCAEAVLLGIDAAIVFHGAGVPRTIGLNPDEESSRIARVAFRPLRDGGIQDQRERQTDENTTASAPRRKDDSGALRTQAAHGVAFL